MYIVFVIGRNIIVDNAVDVIHVNTTGSNIGCHQNGGSAAFEGTHNAVALGLLHIAVETVCFEAVFIEEGGQLINHSLGVGEDDGAFWIMLRQKQQKHIVFTAHRHFVIELTDGIEGHLLFVDLNNLRLFLVVADDLHDLFRHGSGEEDGLAFFRNFLQNGFDILAEAHAEHFIRFVQNDHFAVVQLQGVATHMVHDTTRSTYNDISISQLHDLAIHWRTAVYCNHFNTVGIFCNLFNFICSLYSQLAGWAEQQNLYGTFLLGGIDHVDGRNTEGCGFTGTCLGTANHIVTHLNQRDTLRLDLCGIFEAHFFQCAESRRRKT